MGLNIAWLPKAHRFSDKAIFCPPPRNKPNGQEVTCLLRAQSARTAMSSLEQAYLILWNAKAYRTVAMFIFKNRVMGRTLLVYESCIFYLMCFNLSLDSKGETREKMHPYRFTLCAHDENRVSVGHWSNAEDMWARLGQVFQSFERQERWSRGQIADKDGGIRVVHHVAKY